MRTHSGERMSHPHGTDCGGIRTVEDLMGRCVVDTETDCWIWGMSRSKPGGAPSLWLPALGKRTSIGVAICVLMTGAGPKKGQCWHATCGTPYCANPAHRKCGNRSTQMLALKMERTPLQVVRMTAGRRANSKLSEEAAAEIRQSTEVLRVIAEKHGISLSHAGLVRSGKLRRPLAAPGSSVFNFARQA